GDELHHLIVPTDTPVVAGTVTGLGVLRDPHRLGCSDAVEDGLGGQGLLMQLGGRPPDRVITYGRIHLTRQHTDRIQGLPYRGRGDLPRPPMTLQARALARVRGFGTPALALALVRVGVGCLVCAWFDHVSYSRRRV